MRLYIIITISAIFLASCSGGIYQTISSDYDKSIDFSKYKTYAWLNKNEPHKDIPYDNEIIDNNIMNYVDAELANRNYTPQESQPDLLFELVMSNKQKTRTTSTPIYTTPTYSQYPPNSYRYYNQRNYRWNNHRYNNYNYVRPSYQIGNKVVKTNFDRSTITINVIERASNKLVWTGSAKGDVYDEDYIQDDIHPAVIKILKRYPIQKNDVKKD